MLVAASYGNREEPDDHYYAGRVVQLVRTPAVTQEAAGSSPVAPANLDPSLHVESIPLSPIAGNIRGPTMMGEPVGDSVAL